MVRVSTSLANISRVLVLNAGSSSLKFKLFDQAAGGTLVPGMGGLVERIGDVANSTLITKGPTASGEIKKSEVLVPAKDHVSAMNYVMDFLSQAVSSNVKDEVKAVGHRIVHGLDISKPALLTDQVINTIKRAAGLAPLHNPPGLQGISAAMTVFANKPQVAVFDTAYHQTMPPKAYMYGLPYDLYEKHAIRRYGFHGTSHQFLARQAASMLSKPVDQLNAISCHLGAGASLAAIKNGHSVDTTMGMTPLEGLLMCTRSGDLDPAIVLHLQNTLGYTTKDMDTLLNKKSGLLGLTGAADVRSVLALRDKGDDRGTLALDMLVYRVRKYIGAYSTALDGDVDALIFSAGIGENSPTMRNLICRGLQNLGIKIDPKVNEQAVGVQADISARDAKVRVLVIPTDEELGIAQQTMELLRMRKAANTAAAA